LRAVNRAAVFGCCRGDSGDVANAAGTGLGCCCSAWCRVSLRSGLSSPLAGVVGSLGLVVGAALLGRRVGGFLSCR
jgi:hypothetical protein